MKSMKDIIAQNPVRLLMKIEMLKQEESFFANAAKENSENWLGANGINFLNE